MRTVVVALTLAALALASTGYCQDMDEANKLSADTKFSFNLDNIKVPVKFDDLTMSQLRRMAKGLHKINLVVASMAILAFLFVTFQFAQMLFCSSKETTLSVEKTNKISQVKS